MMAMCTWCSALEELDSANAERFLRLVAVAREQCAGSGESDLRRLKRQFSTLKNTFLHYDVKEAFIDGAPPPPPRGVTCVCGPRPCRSAYIVLRDGPPKRYCQISSYCIERSPLQQSIPDPESLRP